MRLRATAAAFAAVFSLATPAVTYADVAPRPPAGLYAVDDIDGIAAAMHAHLREGAATMAREGYGTATVPSYAEVRADVVATVARQTTALAPAAVVDPLDESTDTIEPFGFDAHDVAGTCVSTMRGEGSKIAFVPVYRHVWMEGVHSCSGAYVIVCLTKAVVPSNQPFIVGIGVGDSSGGCFAKTGKSGFTSKPTYIAGVNLLLVSANEGYGVGLVPFLYRLG